MFVSMSPVSTYLYVSLFLVIHHYVAAAAGPNGFSMKLIHRNSMVTLYPGNLTFEERIERLFHQWKIDSIKGADPIKGADGTETLEPDVPHPKITLMSNQYLVSVKIGTFHPSTPVGSAHQTMQLLLDTGGNLTWIQCQGCHPCFPQKLPLFHWFSSRSYKPLTCDSHPSCPMGHCARGKCIYSVVYQGGYQSTGFLATENFVLDSADLGFESHQNIVVGCGRHQTNFPMRDPSDMTGILGLGRGGHESFLNQIADHTGGKFSYCLQHPKSDPSIHTYLRFGDQAQFPHGLATSSTPLYYKHLDANYYVRLDDISIGEKKLNYPLRSFYIGEHFPGCSLNPGSTFTFMRPAQYARIKKFLTDHFERHHLNVTRMQGMDLCYTRPANFNDFPNMVYHFQSARLEVDHTELFLISPNYFCLSIIPANLNRGAIIIGNFHQANNRFVYDLRSHQMKFAKEHCA